MSHDAEERYFTPRGTELAGEEHGSSHDGDAVSEAERTDLERQEEDEVGVLRGFVSCGVVCLGDG